MWLNKKGFTLLELMIVVIVIGILASIAMPRYVDTIERARLAEALTNLDVIRASEKRYWAEQLGWVGTGSYTNSIDDLDIDNPNDETIKMFTYTVTGAAAEAFIATAVRVGDATRYISINQDGTIVRTGY